MDEITKLKAEVYDCSVLIEDTRKRIDQINQKIFQLSNTSILPIVEEKK